MAGVNDLVAKIKWRIELVCAWMRFVYREHKLPCAAEIRLEVFEWRIEKLGRNIAKAIQPCIVDCIEGLETIIKSIDD